MRLFIIGNGFDLDHGAESSFTNFKVYLEATYLPSINRDYLSFPNVGIGKDGEIVVNPNNSAQILYSMLKEVSGDNWYDFENNLGELNYQPVLDLVEKDDNPFRYYENLISLVDDFSQSLLFSVSSLFCEWVEQINTEDVEKKYHFLDCDLFVTFNYTDILENVYGIKPSNICHVHGSVCDGFCVVGHCNKNRSFEEYDDIVSSQINRLHNTLEKDTAFLYYQNIGFFNQLYCCKITDMVFFGFSLNQIDLFYIKQIFMHIDTSNVNLYLSPYEDQNERNYKISKILECGFHGKYCGPFSNDNR